ncbi:hypothetical protein Cpir12675_004960 [Ceratocystis pirilliformis]|uniref:Uncharacterized protein n=1 Tax=Ceratocystis pirilliformis TaxID=259994 RepID=A0ABR3YU09_9PEZI
MATILSAISHCHSRSRSSSCNSSSGYDSGHISDTHLDSVPAPVPAFTLPPANDPGFASGSGSNPDSSPGTNSGSSPTSSSPSSPISDSSHSSLLKSPTNRTTPSPAQLESLVPWKWRNFIYLESPAQKLVNQHMASVKINCRIAGKTNIEPRIQPLPFPIAEKLWVKTLLDGESTENCIWGLAIPPGNLPSSSIKEALMGQNWTEFNQDLQTYAGDSDMNLWRDASLASVLIRAYDGMLSSKSLYGYVSTCEAIIFLAIPNLGKPGALLFHVHIPPDAEDGSGKINPEALKSQIEYLTSFLIHVANGGSETTLGPLHIPRKSRVSSPITPKDEVQDGTLPRILSCGRMTFENEMNSVDLETSESNSDNETAEYLLNDKLQSFGQGHSRSIADDGFDGGQQSSSSVSPVFSASPMSTVSSGSSIYEGGKL